METNETISSGNISHRMDAEILDFAVNTTLHVILGLQGCIATVDCNHHKPNNYNCGGKI